MYRLFNVTGDQDLINHDRLNYTKHTKKALQFYSFKMVTKQTGEFLTPKTLKDRFSGLSSMKNFLQIDETPPMLEQSFQAVTKFKHELLTDKEMERLLY